ncbi:MAG: hypothetical protein AAFV93_14495 [Chloroflexota bacterium]
MYQIEWYVANKVVLVTLSGDVTVKELTELNKIIVDDYLTGTSNKVHLVINGTDITKLPNDLFGITKASKPLMDSPNIGSSIYVNFLNSILGFLANAATQIVGQPYKMVKSMDEADAVLGNLGVAVVRS